MKLHKIAWFEANVGQTIYPIFSEAVKAENPTLTARKEASGIFVKHIPQAHLLYNNQIQVGTRYYRKEEGEVAA